MRELGGKLLCFGPIPYFYRAVFVRVYRRPLLTRVVMEEYSQGAGSWSSIIEQGVDSSKLQED
jgi:hypothetical protein